MIKTLIMLAFLLACSSLALAQSDAPAVEVFGGYSYLRTASGIDTNANGWNASATFNVNNHVGLKADFAGHYQSEKIGTVKITEKQHTYLFGLQGSLRSTERVNPFVHALFGAANSRVTIAGVTGSDTGFAMALGGGVDVKLNNNLSWRLFQADYLLTRYSKVNINNFRLSTGLVIH